MYLDELKKVLHEGFLIRTQYSASDRQQYNIIRSIYDDTIIINLNRPMDNSSNTQGREILLRLRSPEAEYVAKGKILDVSDSLPLTGKVKLFDVSRYINQRRFDRYLTDYGCIIKDSTHGIGVRSFVRNISLAGLYLESDIEFDTGMEVKLDMLTSKGTVICLNGKIIRKDDLEEGKKGYGIKFKDNSSEYLMNLESLVKQLEEVEFSLLNEWQKKENINTIKAGIGLKVLIVDDIKITRLYLRNIIHSCGITEIYEASNGNDAIQKISVYNPDIVTLDISMPGIDGIEVLKHMKGLNYTPRIIVVSAFGDDYLNEKLAPLGVRYMLSKPFEESRLRGIISEICEEDLS